MTFDRILEEAGSFGCFQMLIVAMFIIPRMVLPCHFLLNNFIAVVPSHHCALGTPDKGGLLGELPLEKRLSVSIPAWEDGSLHSCEMFAEPQFHLLSNVSNATGLPTVQCHSGWVYDNSTFVSTLATESQTRRGTQYVPSFLLNAQGGNWYLSSSLTRENTWDLVCGRKGMEKATGTIFFVGVMFGAIFFGALCDKYGRKPTLLLSYLMAIIFGVSSSFANSYIVFAVLRFLTGFGLTGITLISIVLSIEWVDTGHRAFIGVIGSMAWSVGNMVLAGVAYLVNDWRMLLIAITAPLGFSALTWWWVPESARWLFANGKVEQAQYYLDRCAQFNKRGKLASKLKFEVAAIFWYFRFAWSTFRETQLNPVLYNEVMYIVLFKTTWAIQIYMYMIQTLSNLENSEDQKKTYTYLDLFRTPKMRWLSLLTGIVWYGVASTYYGISLNITGFGLNIYLTHFIYGLIELPAKLSVYFLLNIIGRRKCQAGTLLLTGTCIFINIFVPKDFWLVRTIVAVLGKGLSEAAFTTVFLYTTELFPTVVRQNGVGYTSVMARIGVAIAPLILLLDEVWRHLPEIIICSVAFTSGLVALLLPETLNATLRETIEDIEKPRQKPGWRRDSESDAYRESQ